jgi:DNA-binding NarL/FixJ family response regulator
VLAVLAARMRQSAAGSLSAHRVADLLLLAQAYLASGDPELALELAHDGIDLSRRTGAQEHLAGLHVVVARAHLARGEIEPACAAAALAIAEGWTNRQIADVLILSEKTVKRHLSNIFAKLGVGTRAAAVRSAFQSGIL